jgi:hypothetical protein
MGYHIVYIIGTLNRTLEIIILGDRSLKRENDVQGDSLARGPTEVYLQIFNEFVNQLANDELTTGYYQQDGATCHTSNVSMREIESFLKTELSQKTFGHPDLPI